MLEPMTPEQAREVLAIWPAGLPTGSGYRAFKTIAAMTTEADYRVVPHEQVAGRYVTRRYERHVTEWQEAKGLADE